MKPGVPYPFQAVGEAEGFMGSAAFVAGMRAFAQLLDQRTVAQVIDDLVRDLGIEDVGPGVRETLAHCSPGARWLYALALSEARG